MAARLLHARRLLPRLTVLRLLAQSPTGLGSEDLLVGHAESARVAEPPSARDRRDSVGGRVRSLQVTVGPVEAHPSQVLQRRRAEIATERVLHRARGNTEGRRYVRQPDVAVRVVVDKRD